MPTDRIMNQTAPTRPGFTLIELLVAVGVIGLLASIALVAGGQVVASSKRQLTLDTIGAMDQVLDVYMNERGAIPLPYVRDPRTEDFIVNNGWHWILIDGKMGNAGTATADELTEIPGQEGLSGNTRTINSSGWFGQQLRDVPSADAVFSGLPAEVLRTYSPLKEPDAEASFQPPLPTPFDSWGRPLRYVHPALDGLLTGGDGSDPTAYYQQPAGDMGLRSLRGLQGANRIANFRLFPENLRRNNSYTGPVGGATDLGELPDSDGGFCPGNRPYFYSAGPDGDPSTVSDNVYITVPEIDELRG